MTAGEERHSVAREQTRFFGRVSAAISHEINNRFAVIYEKAGLIQDLAMMMESGKPIDPARFGGQSTKIIEQVQMAKAVVEKLNRFAHSVDVDYREVNLPEVFKFVIALYSRKLEAVDAQIKVNDPPEPATLKTDPFALQTVLGGLLDIALSGIGEERNLSVEFETFHNGVTIRMTGISLRTERLFPDELAGLPAVIDRLGASFRTEDEGAKLILDLPRFNPE